MVCYICVPYMRGLPYFFYFEILVVTFLSRDYKSECWNACTARKAFVKPYFTAASFWSRKLLLYLIARHKSDRRTSLGRFVIFERCHKLPRPWRPQLERETTIDHLVFISYPSGNVYTARSMSKTDRDDFNKT